MSFRNDGLKQKHIFTNNFFLFLSDFPRFEFDFPEVSASPPALYHPPHSPLCTRALTHFMRFFFLIKKKKTENHISF